MIQILKKILIKWNQIVVHQFRSCYMTLDTRFFYHDEKYDKTKMDRFSNENTYFLLTISQGLWPNSIRTSGIFLTELTK